jgi:pimeloyl-ACP methyl ester carboxylesterase
VTVSPRLHRSLLAGLLALAGVADAPLLVPSFRLLGQAPATTRSPRAAIEPADRFVTVNGLRIHYLDWGNPEKPPLILLHGIARVAHTFDHIAPALRDRYHVIAVDMRGHGDSDWDPSGGYLVEDHVKDLEGLIRQLGLPKVVLLGNSTGGRVAQVYAGLHPEMMSALIVEDVGPERPKSIAENFARQVREEANGWNSEEELLAVLKTRNPGVAESQLKTYAHFGTKRGENGRVVWKRDPDLAKGFVETELWQYVRRITCPAIYIIGGRSTIVPPETQEQLRRTVAGVQVVTMPGLGHYPDAEAPAAFLEIVDRFLATATRP